MKTHPRCRSAPLRSGAAAIAVGLMLASCEPSRPLATADSPIDVALANGNNGAGPKAAAFSGDATVIQASILGLDPLVLGRAGPLPSAGGAEESSLLTVDQSGIHAEVLHASTVGHGDRSRSEASVAEFSVLVGGQSIAASFLMARAEAVCTKDGAVTSGGSHITSLVINGQAITVSGSPNQTITLPMGAGQVVINEQQTSPGDITVNALHITVTGVADIIVAQAHADVVCRGNEPCDETKDFVTGGGWITAPSGAKGTFAVAGGIKNGAFWGHLQYHDHGAGPRAKGTGVTAYVVVDATTRRIDGTAEIDGAPGTYSVTVSDNGEPGTDDRFVLTLSTGYTAAGTLGGGNIQLHVQCKS